MKFWKKLSSDQISERVFSALDKNVNYYEENILGVPASHLDSKVFYQGAAFLKEAPFISTLIRNPNHIGCHTLGESEHFFKGTQDIERELIDICAYDILRGGDGEFDGYVASGGTEANIQAIWIYRNYFKEEFAATYEEICILCSEDSHYSMTKAANLLNIDVAYTPVDFDCRELDEDGLRAVLKERIDKGQKYFIVVANMMTTMFGSVDNLDLYIKILKEFPIKYKIHIDGAYGGFFYPMANSKNKLNFASKEVSSITLDAHKMAQAPYGTGIFIARKGLIGYANTKEASYVEGEDYTLVGSRSGANAVAIWMILMANGPYGWKEKVLILLHRTAWLCAILTKEKIKHYRQPHSNIITIQCDCITPEIAREFGLVPDNHHNPVWYKLVIMDHVTIEKLLPLVEKIVGNVL